MMHMPLSSTASALAHAEPTPPRRSLLAVLEHAPMAIALVTDGRFETVSRELERLVGCGRGGLNGRRWEGLVPSQSAGLRRGCRQAWQDGRAFEAEVLLRRADGSWLWVRAHGAAAQGPGLRQHSIWTLTDATELRRQRAQLQWQATRDPLTELPNRREFERELEELLSDRRRPASACALFIDLDHFKQVNDAAGHGAGDALLKRVAQALCAGVRAEDSVARLGGDEFAVLLRGCGLQEARQVAEKLRAAIESQRQAGPVPVGVTASVGIVEIDATLATLAEVLEAADRACYAAKRAGRNRVGLTVGLRGPVPEAPARPLSAHWTQRTLSA